VSQSIRERRAESLGRSIRIKQTRGKALSKRKLRASEKHRKQVAQISHRNGAVVDKGFDVFAKDLKIGTVQKRTSFMFSIVALLLVGLGVRVAMLQTVWAGEYRDASVAQRTRVQTLRAERGSILDRNGQELALPIPTRTVFADPRSVTDPIGVANAVGDILQMTDEAKLELSIKLRDQNSSFVYVARQADQRLADVIVALGLKGVSSYRESGRALTSSGLRGLIGRTDIDGLGISGLELQYQELLAGQDGRIAREVNASGKSMAAGSSDVVEAVPGGRLITTINRTIQFQVDSILTQQVQFVEARGGSAIVMDTKTGEIYAMSNIRQNTDGSYSSDSGNFAAVEAYEPGSVAKVFSIAAAMNEGKVVPSTSFTVPYEQIYDKGTEWEYKVSDGYVHPIEDMTVRKIIVDSSNNGTVLISRLLDSKNNHNYLQSFGFGTKTPVNYPAESRGVLKPAEKWQGTEKITFAYGYGYTATGLQLVSAVNAIANKGVYIAPKLVKATVDAKGVVTDTPQSPTHEVVSVATAKAMTEMLTDVVCYGTGGLAQLSGMSVAGKTGTAYKLQKNGKYTAEDGTNSYFASFVGFLPAGNPQMTVLVSIDEPDPTAKDRFGGRAAAPVFARIGQALVNELDIRPTQGDVGCTGSRPSDLGASH
jgi:cell division protein FtsI (penicillin-binding protein 3)